MAPSAARVASAYLPVDLPVELFSAVMSAIRPVYTGDPDDADVAADRVVDHLLKGFNAAHADPLSKARVTAFGPRDSESASWEHDGHHRSTHYWCEVTYPTSVTMSWAIRLKVARRWSEALRAARLGDTPMTPKVERALEALALEVADLSVPDHLSNVARETLETVLYSDEFRGFDMEASSSSTSDYSGEEEDHNETWDVDARFAFEPQKAKAKLTASIEGGELRVSFAVPVGLRFQKLVSPWSPEYMQPRP